MKSGAKILIEGLQREGVETIFGYPGGVCTAHLRRAVQCTHPAHPGTPRAGGRPCGGRVCEGERARRRLPRYLGPGGLQPRHRHRHGLHGLRAHHRAHRPGADQPPGERRIPGGGHLGHHPAHHQALLPGEGYPRPVAGDQGGVLHREDGTARGRCSSISRRTSPRTRSRTSP